MIVDLKSTPHKTPRLIVEGGLVNGNGDSGLSATVSAKLFENPDNSIIVFDYYNDPDIVSSFEGYLWGGLAGLYPGDGSAGTPGEGDPRDYSTGSYALWTAMDDSPVHLHEGTEDQDVPYTSMFNLGEGPTPIPLDSFLVFVPDRWNISEDRGPIYSVTFGGRNLVVDSDSVDQAINDIIDDQETSENIMDGEFCEEDTYKDYEGHLGDLLPGIYEAEDALNGLKNDGMLAYIFKYEEYLVNKEIVKNSNISNTLKAQLMAGSANAIASIRDLDAALEEMSDAKANFVQKDIHGNWVRTQQWMLRPNNTQIQMLNITHRGSGPLKGSSGMDFSAFLTEAYSTNLSAKDLPWDSWLATRTNKSGVRYIENSSKAPELESMYVKMFNPTGEFIKEERSFDSRVDERQVISNEELTLANEGNINNPAMYTFDKGLSFDNNEYRVDSGVGKFNYVFGDSSINSIEVAFFAVGDGANNGNNYQYSNDIHDIWDALRVNSQHGPEIGENNLEIVVDATRNGDRKYNYFVNPIDVIYVPMNRMIWKAKEEPVS
ncbi:hypothetical protein PITCH_A2290001 [uncultured Desulfobacterium sp.]|uniref:Uncharacterized protein n=1 Tax=uncultured Desulfobacterium sp. TaxID=201089 RepID=A0A445MY61_9BACT|nr:hypothetical protein PITCH_A2290001 [uncultured Desulfobacterium sp.]